MCSHCSAIHPAGAESETGFSCGVRAGRLVKKLKVVPKVTPNSTRVCAHTYTRCSLVLHRRMLTRHTRSAVHTITEDRIRVRRGMTQTPGGNLLKSLELR